jgi:hypothetical protein
MKPSAVSCANKRIYILSQVFLEGTVCAGGLAGVKTCNSQNQKKYYKWSVIHYILFRQYYFSKIAEKSTTP